MKIILLKDVEKLGKRLDLKNAKPGYARNFLIPRKLAIPATKVNFKWQAREIEVIKKEKEKILEKKKKLEEKLKDFILKIKVKTGIKGELFEKINKEKIVKSLKEKDFDMVEDNIQLKEPIEKIGEYPLKINLEDGIETKIKIIVLKETQKKRSSKT